MALALYGFPYVINLGWGNSWGGAPGTVLGLWLLYTFAHLGFSFLLAAVLATPGCEMRALPHLWTLVTGRSTAEHYCPGPLDRVDRWEIGKRRGEHV